MKRADLKVGFSCNNHCLFCVQGKKRQQLGDKTTGQIKKEMNLAAKDCRGIVLTGGEPTIRPDILELVRYAKKIGFKVIQIQTNGRLFAYKSFCEQIIKAGATEFSPALHGHTAALHDYLTGSQGSFFQTIKGIKNLKSMGQKVITNTVITKSNYRHLPQIAELLVLLDVDQFQFAFVHALGSAGQNFGSVVPRMELVEPHVKKGLDIGIKTGKTVMTEAIPYCLMRGYEKYVAERIIPNSKIYDYNKIIDDFNQARRYEGKSKGPQCKKCRYYEICEGPWREYPEKFGWGEFRPIIREDKISASALIVDDLWEMFIRINDLSGCSQKIRQLKDVLFSDSNYEWLGKNQKFDFSFSFPERQSWRFSYNDYGEKDIFFRKLQRIFKLFANQYNVKIFKKIMSLMGARDAFHQTTFGFEWPNGADFPRLKIYFEELFNVYNARKTRELAKKLTRKLAIKNVKPCFGRHDTVAALCVDFFPNNGIALKSYILKKKLADVERELKRESEFFNHEAWVDFKSIKDDKSFFYLTRRINQAGELESLKIYRIFEYSLDKKNIRRRNVAIGRLLKKYKFNRNLSLFNKYLRSKNIQSNPVILAVDFDRDKKVKMDYYLTFNK